MLVQNISRGHEILKTFWNFGAPYQWSWYEKNIMVTMLVIPDGRIVFSICNHNFLHLFVSTAIFNKAPNQICVSLQYYQQGRLVRSVCTSYDILPLLHKGGLRPPALVSENYVFSGGAKICNEIFRIGVTPPTVPQKWWVQAQFRFWPCSWI